MRLIISVNEFQIQAQLLIYLNLIKIPAELVIYSDLIMNYNKINTFDFI